MLMFFIIEMMSNLRITVREEQQSNNFENIKGSFQTKVLKNAGHFQGLFNKKTFEGHARWRLLPHDSLGRFNLGGPKLFENALK